GRAGARRGGAAPVAGAAPARSSGGARSEADGDGLDLDEIVDAVGPVLPAQAGFLVASEGDVGPGGEGVVGADDAVVEALGDAEDAPHVTGEEVGGEAVGGVVRR